MNSGDCIYLIKKRVQLIKKINEILIELFVIIFKVTQIIQRIDKEIGKRKGNSMDENKEHHIFS